MFQKILKYSVIFFCLLVWLAGCSRHFQQWLGEKSIIPDDYRYGDLYRLSYLPQFKQSREHCPKFCSTEKLPIHLYVIGDSFLEPGKVDAADFCVQRYTYTHWNDTTLVSLDKKVKNILILETVERHFREHFAKPVRNIQLGRPLNLKKDESAIDFIFPDKDKVEDRLERAMFGFDIFLVFKELKANLNHCLFQRVNDQVALSKDEKHVFSVMDTDTTQINSPYRLFPEAEEKTLVTRLNMTQNEFKSMGFDAVYLAIIPNKASILAPTDGNYNHLIERIEQHPARQVSCLSIYQYCTEHPLKVYERGDSHWNCMGRDYWLKQANTAISQ